MKKAYLISSIEEYGKFISFCINKDVSVFRTYWDEREIGNRCYCIDWSEKRCYYARYSYYVENDIPVVLPEFVLDQFGNYHLSSRIYSGSPAENKNDK